MRNLDRNKWDVACFDSRGWFIRNNTYWCPPTWDGSYFLKDCQLSDNPEYFPNKAEAEASLKQYLEQSLDVEKT